MEWRGCSLLACGAQDLALPNGFTPNEDGANDFFIIKGIENYTKNHFTVFNRWGNLVYEKDNYHNEWQGQNYSGQILSDGTYYVIINVNDGLRILNGFVDMRR